MSITIVSPSATSAITPPAAASGAMWQIDSPEVPPENRPSVISAQARPSPFPFRNDVGYSISCMPGPPRGPSYLITTTSPAATRPERMPSTASSCDSKTLAGPLKVNSSSGTPAVFTIAPSGARLPYSTASPPSAVYACATSRMHPDPASRSSDAHRADCEYAFVVRTPPGAAWYSSTASSEAAPDRRSQAAIGCPCTVCTVRLSSPARSSSPRIVWMPPARCTSSTWYELDGATLHRHGTRRDSSSISLSPKSMPPSWAAASRCRIVLVEPPIATSSAIAFSNASLLATERGSTDSSPSS